MMTTLVSSMNIGLDLRQMMQPMQLKANEKTTAEELKADEQLQAETVSTQKINVMKSSTDLRMLHIHQAAEAGLLRPVWLEMLEMDPDMPRTSEMIRKAGDNTNSEVKRMADEAKERAIQFEQATDGAERVAKSEQAADGAERTAKSERTADGAERAAKSEHAVSERSTDGAERTTKSERASDGARSDVNSYE